MHKAFSGHLGFPAQGSAPDKTKEIKMYVVISQYVFFFILLLTIL